MRPNKGWVSACFSFLEVLKHHGWSCEDVFPTLAAASVLKTMCGRVLKAVVSNNENSERQGSFPSHLQVLLCWFSYKISVFVSIETSKNNSTSVHKLLINNKNNYHYCYWLITNRITMIHTYTFTTNNNCCWLY